MSSAVVILTSARETDDPFEYLRRTIEQLEAEKLDTLFSVVCDGPYAGPKLPDRWSLVELERSGGLPGNKRAYWRALERGLELEDFADVIVLEDDLRLCRNALRRMATLPVPRDLDWVQFFQPQLFAVAKTYIGMWRPPPATHMFTQALKFPRRTLRRLLAWSKTDEFNQFTGSDQALLLASKALDLRFGAHVPELVQHAGEQSAAAPELRELEDFRRAKTWPGPNFDAMDLYMRDELYR